jgi:UrcA family protein
VRERILTAAVGPIRHLAIWREFPAVEGEMNGRGMACTVAAGFIVVLLTTAATDASAKGRGPRTVVVEGPAPVDPALQRKVAYGDLNLAFRPQRQIFRARISRAAIDVCGAINEMQDDADQCYDLAIHSTDKQVLQAIGRAKQRMAGIAVGPDTLITMVAAAP